MYGAIFALLITVLMISMVIFKGHRAGGYAILCRKSDLASVIDTLSDDAIIQIWIGRNSYEHTGADNS